MKLVSMFALLFAVALSTSASAARKQKFARIDLRTQFRSTSINMYPDGTPVYDGVDILVPDVSRNVEKSIAMSGGGTCRFLGVTNGTRSATIRVLADLEIDEGSCVVTIKLRDGRKVTVDIENIGT